MCTARRFDAENGLVPGSPLNMAKRRRIAGDPANRASACKEFAENPRTYRSLKVFVEEYGAHIGEGEWRPSKSQMARDMVTIFGKDWAARRGGGGRARGGGKQGMSTAPGLTMPDDGRYKLEPSHHPTTLSSAMEHRVIEQIRSFEVKFGTSIITPILIESLAMHEVLRQLPNASQLSASSDGNDDVELQNVMNVVHRQLKSVSSNIWVRSFLHRHKRIVRRTSCSRALEQHKAAKHQPELVLAHFRNLFHAEALAQIQRHVAREKEDVTGFVKFESIIQEVGSESTSQLDSLLELRGDTIFVKALNCPLEHVEACRRYALDETPVNPDSPMLKAYTVVNGVPLSRGRASIWTLMPVLCGDGSVTACLLLQRCQSVPVDAAKFC